MRFGPGVTSGRYRPPRLSNARPPKHTHPPALVRSIASARREAGVVHLRQQPREAGIGIEPSHARVRTPQARAMEAVAAAVQLHRRGKDQAANRRLMQAGVIGGSMVLPQRFANDLLQTGYYTPGGIYSAVKGGGEDVGAVAHGDLSFKHSRALMKALAVSTAQDFRHPLRHPGFTALDLFAIASAGAGTATRVGGAGRAIAEGAGVRAALTRPGFEGGSLLHRPPPREIEIAPGVHVLEPDNPLLRPLTRMRAAGTRRQLDHPDVHEAPTWLGRQVQEHVGAAPRVGRELRANYRIPRPGGEKAKQLARLERHMSKEERTAGRVVLIEGNHAIRYPEEAVARQAEQHRQWAEEWLRSLPETSTNKERKTAVFYAKVNELVAQDIERSLPVLKRRFETPEGRRFLDYAVRMRRLSRQAEREAIAHGDLTPEIAAERLSNMARVYRGGKTVVERAQKARRAHVREYPGQFVTEQQLGRATVRDVITRPRTRGEAESRLAEIEKAMGAVEEKFSGKYKTVDADYQRYLNKTKGLRAKSEQGIKKAGTAKANRAGNLPQGTLAQQLFDREFPKYLERHPELARYWHGLDEEASLLRESLSAQHFPGEAPAATRDFGTVRQIIARPGEPAVVSRSIFRQGRRVTVPAREARRASSRIEGGIGPEGLAAPRGSAYFPAGDRFKQLAAPVHENPVNLRGSAYGHAPPSRSRGMLGTTNRFSARSLMQGVVEKPGQAIALRYAAQHRLYAADDLYEHARLLGTDRRESHLQVAVRDKRGIPDALRRQIDSLLERAGGGDENALGEASKLLRQNLEDEHLTNTTGLGEEVEGVKWVDRRFLKELYGSHNSRLLKFAAAFNTPFRFFGIYLRPAYFMTNYPQNASMAMIEQGIVRGTANLVRARRSVSLYGRANTDWMESEAGTARTESYLPTRTRSKARRVERHIVEGITHITDRDMRIAAFLYRAAERGFKTRDDLTRLRTDPKLDADRRAVVRRMRRDAVDFDSMTPVEKELVDLVYFYPWMSRATAWTGRVALNRPIKAGIAGQLSKVGKREQAGALGPIPHWLQGYIATKLGFVNTAPLWTPSTPAQIADEGAAIAGLEPNPHDSTFGEQFGAPFLQALTSKNPGAVLTSTAPAYLLQRLGVTHIGPLSTGRPSVTFPAHGLWPALGPFLFGGSFPRKADLLQIRKQAQLEHKGRGGVGGPQRRPRGIFPGQSGSGGGSIFRGGGSSSSGSIFRSP